MYDFSNYKKDVSYEYFKNYIKQKDKIKIIIIHNNENKIIGAGSIFKLEKLHNNPIGQIEDVIIEHQLTDNFINLMKANNLTVEMEFWAFGYNVMRMISGLAAPIFYY